jgi:hypothetical protein
VVIAGCSEQDGSFWNTKHTKIHEAHEEVEPGRRGPSQKSGFVIFVELRVLRVEEPSLPDGADRVSGCREIKSLGGSTAAAGGFRFYGSQISCPEPCPPGHCPRKTP